MKLDRQKILALGFGVIAALFGGRWVWQTMVEEPLETLRKSKASAEKKVDSARMSLVEARGAKLDLDKLGSLSLPGDPTQAQEIYQSYWIELLKEAKIANPTITPGSPSSREGIYLIPFTIKGEGSVDSLTQLLHHFHSTPRLQQISQMSLNPIEQEDMGRGIRFSLSTEALAWAGSEDVKGADAPFVARVDEKPEDYAATVERNVLFARGPGGGAFAGNLPEFVVLTSIIREGGQAEADVYDRGVNQTKQLRVGDVVTIGDTNATVLDLGLRDAVLESDGMWWLWELGSSYSARTPLTPQQALEREFARSRQ